MKRQGQKLFSRRGIGILEALVGLTISILVMLGMSKMISFQGRVQQNLKVNSEFENSLQRLTQYLSLGGNCANLLPANTLVAPGSDISISQIPQAGNAILTTATNGPDARNFLINSINLNNFQNTSVNDRLTADLIIVGKKANTGVAGDNLYKKIPLYIRTSAGVFQDCSNSSLNNVTCGQGTYLQSIDSSGNPVCTAPTVETRTSDPPNPSPGAMWLRTDIHP